MQLTLIAALSGTGVAWAAYALTRATSRESVSGDLLARLQSTRLGIDALRERTLAGLERLDDLLRDEEHAALGRLEARGSTAAGEAVRLGVLAELDWLEIVAPDGTIVSSSAWPEQAGLRQPEWLALGTDAARLRELTAARSVTPGLVARRVIATRSGALHLIGGTFVDGDALRAAGGHDSIALRISSDDSEVRLLGDLAMPPSRVWRRLAGGPPGVVAEEVDGERFLFARLALGQPGDLEAWLVGASALAPLERRLTSLVRLLAAIVLGATALAALTGAWVARGVTGRVSELVRAVDAIAEGTEDYTFDHVSRDEFDSLTASFSRLHRALALQRQRSRAAERVAAWREVARRVAHEVKNPLAPIRLTVQNLKRARARDAALFEAEFDDGAATILEEVDRLERLVGEFSQFARLPLPEPVETDLVELIDETVGLFRATPGVDLEVLHADRLPPVLVDRDQVARALQNVLGNAVEALADLPQGATRRIALSTGLEDGLVRIDVEDSGPGLAPEALEHLFEPYFTTKTGGTGLGLSIVYRILAEHGGVVSASNREGGGVRVTLRLPPGGPDSVASSAADPAD